MAPFASGGGKEAADARSFHLLEGRGTAAIVKREEVGVLSGGHKEPAVVQKEHLLDGLGLSKVHVRVGGLLQSGGAQVCQRFAFTDGEDVSILGNGDGRGKGELVVKLHFPGNHVKLGRSVVGPQIEMAVRSRNDVSDLVAGEIVFPILCLERFELIPVPNVEAVHGTNVEVAQGVLVDGANGVVGDAFRGGNGLDSLSLRAKGENRKPQDGGKCGSLHGSRF